MTMKWQEDSGQKLNFMQDKPIITGIRVSSDMLIRMTMVSLNPILTEKLSVTEHRVSGSALIIL